MAKLLLIRHAERPRIPENTIGNAVVLTEKGKADTQTFARQVSDRVISIQTSPIERCRQTAAIMADVVGFEHENILLNTDLGGPGFMIENAEQAWVHWQKRGHQKVNEYLLSGSEQWEGFKDLDRAVKTFDKIIRQQLSHSEKGTHLWITHDTILATYASRILPCQLKIDQWPRFLAFISIEYKHGVFTYNYISK